MSRVTPVTMDGHSWPLVGGGMNAGYWRLSSRERFTPPFSFTGRMRLHEVMDPPVFGYGWKKGEKATYSPGINFHPLYPSNGLNVGLGIGRRANPTGAGRWAEMRDEGPPAYRVRTGWYPTIVNRIPDPMDGRWHDFEVEVLTLGHYRLFWDEVLSIEAREKWPFTVPSAPVPVGLRLDFLNIDITDLEVTQNMKTVTGSARTFYGLDPVRILDTRTSPNGRVKSGRVVELPTTGRPPSGATHAAVQVVAVSPSAQGFLTLFEGGSFPGTSNLNYAKGATTTGFSIVPIAGDGSIYIYTSAPTDLVLDLVGYYA